MRAVAIIFIVLTIVANFIFNNITSLVVAIFSFPVLLWVLLKKKKRQKPAPNTAHPVKKTEDQFK